MNDTKLLLVLIASLPLSLVSLWWAALGHSWAAGLTGFLWLTADIFGFMLLVEQRLTSES